jgi:hypothetical protein
MRAAWLASLLVLAGVLVPALVSASIARGPETRVWGFDFQNAAGVGAEGDLSHGSRQAYELWYGGLASDSTVAPNRAVATEAPVGFRDAGAYVDELRAAEYLEELKLAQHAEVTASMQSIVARVATRVRSLGMAALTVKQRARALINPNLYEAYIGNRIDVAARRLILGHRRTGVAPDPVIRGQLPNLRGNYTSGADLVDPPSGRWWDMTTPT